MSQVENITLASTNVSIFPVSNRDVNSRVFSEENLTKFITTNCDNNSFVKCYDANILEFVISGYAFKVNIQEIGNKNNLFAHICLKQFSYNQNGSNYTFYVLQGMDVENKFNGLVFTNEIENEDGTINVSNPFIIENNDQHLYLQLTDNEGKFINTIRFNSYTIDCIDGGTC